MYKDSLPIELERVTSRIIPFQDSGEIRFLLSDLVLRKNHMKKASDESHNDTVIIKTAPFFLAGAAIATF